MQLPHLRQLRSVIMYGITQVSMQDCGQTSRHLPQPVHASVITYPSSPPVKSPKQKLTLSTGLLDRSNHSYMYGLASSRTSKYEGPTSSTSPTSETATEDIVSSPLTPVSDTRGLWLSLR